MNNFRQSSFFWISNIVLVCESIVLLSFFFPVFATDMFNANWKALIFMHISEKLSWKTCCLESKLKINFEEGYSYDYLWLWLFIFDFFISLGVQKLQRVKACKYLLFKILVTVYQDHKPISHTIIMEVKTILFTALHHVLGEVV